MHDSGRSRVSPAKEQSLTPEARLLAAINRAKWDFDHGYPVSERRLALLAEGVKAQYGCTVDMRWLLRL